jgi:hypothetical protein
MVVTLFVKPVLDMEHRLEQEKAKLSFASDFSLAGAFNIFSGYSEARVTNTDLILGLERLSVTRLCDQVDAALVINRFDCDEDKSLSFWEFANIFLPVQ